MKFKVGDIVKFSGLDGKVVAEEGGHIQVELIASRESDELTANGIIKVSFRVDGTLDPGQKESLLELIERPKKKVKKKGWIVVYHKKCVLACDKYFYHTSAVYESLPMLEDDYSSPNEEPFTIQEIEFEVEE